MSKTTPKNILINPKTGKIDNRLRPRGDKLTDAQVIEIRKKYRKGDTTLRKLAAEYKVSHVYISYLVKRKKRITV